MAGDDRWQGKEESTHRCIGFLLGFEYDSKNIKSNKRTK